MSKTWEEALIEYINIRSIPTPGEYFGFKAACRLLRVQDIPDEKTMPNLIKHLRK